MGVPLRGITHHSFSFHLERKVVETVTRFEESRVIAPKNRFGLPCLDLTCTIVCRKRSFLETTEEEAEEHPDVLVGTWKKTGGLVIVASCTRRECKRRAGVDKTVKAIFCEANECVHLTNDSLCGLAGNRTRKAGRLSFEQRKGTLRMNRDKTQGMTYRKFQ